MDPPDHITITPTGFNPDHVEIVYMELKTALRAPPGLLAAVGYHWLLSIGAVRRTK